MQTLQTFDQIRQQHQVSRTYSYSLCEKVEICFAINCFALCVNFRIEIRFRAINVLVIFFVISVDNFFTFLVIFYVVETSSRVISYFFRNIFRIFVDCNITKIDILNRNCLKINRDIEAFSFFDCDTQIDVQYFEETRSLLLVYFVNFVSKFYVIEILFDRERSVSHVL